MVLCFRFVMKASIDNTSVFWLLLNSACTVSRPSMFLTLHLSEQAKRGKKSGGRCSWDSE